MFWPWPSTEYVYQVIEGATSIATSLKHNNYLFGQYADNVPLSRGIGGSPGNTNLSPAAFGACDQSKEIPFETGSENRIFGYGNEFSNRDLDNTTGKSEQAVTAMSGGARKLNDFTLETFQSHRFSVLHSTGSVTISLTTELFTSATDQCSWEGTIVPTKDNIRSGLITGDQIVDKQPSFDRWKVNFSTSLKNCHPDRCIQKGWGGAIAWENQWGVSGLRKSHNCT